MKAFTIALLVIGAIAVGIGLHVLLFYMLMKLFLWAGAPKYIAVIAAAIGALIGLRFSTTVKN